MTQKRSTVHPFQRFWGQFCAHLNIQFSTIPWSSLIFKLCLPALLILGAALSISKSYLSPESHPPYLPIPTTSECSTDGCISLAYSPANITLVDDIVNTMATSLGLSPGLSRAYDTDTDLWTEINEFKNPSIGNTVSFPSVEANTDYTCEHMLQGYDYIRIGFNNTVVSANSPVSPDFGYYLWPTDVAAALMEAIVEHCSVNITGGQQHLLSIDIPATKQLPVTPNQDGVSSGLTTMALLVALALPILSIVSEISGGRESGMAGYLHATGSQDLPQVLAWVVANTLLFTANALAIYAVGSYSGLYLFSNSDPLAVILVCLALGMAFAALGLALAQFFGRPKTAVLVTVFLLIVVLVTSLVLIAVGPMLKLGLDTGELGNGTAFWTRTFRNILPGYHYSIISEALGWLTQPYVNSEGATVQPEGFHVTDFARGLRGEDYNSMEGLVICIGDELLWLVAQTLGYVLIALYLDAILRTGYGARSAPWFFLTPRYWGRGKPQVPELPVSLLPEVKGDFHEGLPAEPVPPIDPAVMREAADAWQEALKPSPAGDSPALLITGLGITYGKPWKADTHVHAVRSMWLRVEPRTCLGLLGLNGAGKSSLISMLIGQLTPTRGTATVCGYDLRSQISQIRRRTGIVFQHDRLYPGVSCQRHCYLAGRMCGLGTKQARTRASELLKRVGLYECKGRRASQLSGGMRRRLSFAMAMMGDPSILFLDEPTSSLDPNARLDMHNLIRESSRSRTVILCSHSMEEVDSLSHRVAIIREGSLMCVGSPVRLKTRFGAGYRIVCEITGKGVAQQLASVIASVSSTATLFPPTPSQCEFLVATDDDITDILRIFEALCPKGGRAPNPVFLASKGLEPVEGLQGWSLKQTQLEDVFNAAANRDVRRRALVGDDPIERTVVSIRYIMENHPELRSMFRTLVETEMSSRGIVIPYQLFAEELGSKRMSAVKSSQQDT